MLRNLMLAVIPVVALSGVVRADEIDGLSDFGSASSFEVDALTAAFDDDMLVDDAEVAAVNGSTEAEIDAVLSAWCAAGESSTLLAQLDAARVPAGPIYNVADMMFDVHLHTYQLDMEWEMAEKNIDDLM